MLSLSLASNIYSGFIQVSADDIIFIEYEKSSEGVFFHTKNEKYYSTGSLKYWLTNLKQTGYRFEKVDRNVAIHLSKVHHLDPHNPIAYFDSTSKYCPIAVSNFRLVKGIIESMAF